MSGKLIVIDQLLSKIETLEETKKMRPVPFHTKTCNYSHHIVISWIAKMSRRHRQINSKRTQQIEICHLEIVNVAHGTPCLREKL